MVEKQRSSKSVLTPIPNYPGYLMTRDERFWSEKSKKWLKTRVDKSSGGYNTVSLCHPVKGWRVLFIHRLLLETFVGPRPPGMECRHLDGNPRNNNLDNLKWGYRCENAADSIKHGTHKSGTRKLNEYKVSWIKQLLDTGRYTNRRIAAVFGVCTVTIRHIKNGKQWAGVA